jgi:GTPase SAR1 family protein
MDVPKLNVALVGNSRVGKSTLIATFLTGNFPPNIHRTFNLEISIAPVRIPEKSDLKIQLWDRGGSSDEGCENLVHLKIAHLILICVDLSNPKSLEIAEAWWDRIECHFRNRGIDLVDAPPIAVVGCKADISIFTPEKNADLKNAWDLWLKQHPIVFYSETSSLAKLYVTELFQHCAKIGLKRLVEQLPTPLSA